MYSALFHRLVIVTFATLLFSLSGPALAAADAPASSPRGLVYAVDADSGERLLVPLESTEVVLDVKPGMLEAEIIQTFSNRTPNALEATYLYPLPGAATITNFELRYRDRIVRSEVREKLQARADYEAAKADGKKTALLEQHDPALFSTAVANFLPGETVRVVLRFVQPLDLKAGSVEVRFPMVTGDKYFPADATPGTPGNAAPDPLRRPVEAMAGNHVYAFDIQVSGFPVSSIESSSHRVRVSPATGGPERFLVSLAEEITLPDRDFVMRVDTRADVAVQPTVAMQQTNTGNYGLLTIFPPRTRRTPNPLDHPRDILFLVDCSGSMQGLRFESAKRGLERCIDSLAERDRFHIVAFGSDFAFYRPGWTTADAPALDEARHHVRALPIRGGTQLQPALGASLSAFETNDRQHVLILITDGDVGNEASLLNLVENRIGRVRLFALGIGTAPNATLIKKVAELGRGQARFIANDNEVDRELTDLFATLAAPVISSVRLSLLDAQGRPIEHVSFPEKLPDVFLSRPIQSVFRITQAAPAAVAIEGIEEGRLVTHRIALQATPLRGDGLEKQFGRNLYADTSMMFRRAKTNEERALVQQEMLATALQFQLVTELTSRVAVDGEIARDPNAVLVSQRVAQYSPADQGYLAISHVTSGSDVMTLTPFVVSTDSDRAGSALTSVARTETNRRGVATEVIKREFLDAFSPTAIEDVLPFTFDALNDPHVSRAGTDVSLLDGLPIATVVDPATVDRITLRSMGPAWSEISQIGIPRVASGTLTARAGDEGYAAFSLKFARSLMRPGEQPLVAVLSWAKFGDVQKSVFLQGQQAFGGGRFRASIQARELDGFGGMRFVRGTFERKIGDAVLFEATVAWHALQRDDAMQFRLGSPDAHYDGLGFFNLDLLTAETRRLADRIAQVRVSGNTRQLHVVQSWSARVRWQRQESDWLTPRPDDPIAARRETRGFDAEYVAALANDRLQLRAQLSGADHRTPHSIERHENTTTSSIGFDWMAKDGWGVSGNWSREAALPWTSTGRWQALGSEWRAIAPLRERREGGQLGLSMEDRSRRWSGQLGVFHQRVSDLTFRDWSWEQARGASGPAVLVDGEFRAAVSTDVWKKLTREGWMGSFTFSPTRSFTTKASWWRDWRSEGPGRGGNQRASLVSHHEVRSGWLKGFATGVGVTYRDEFVFNDGHVLRGGARGDIVFGYRLRGKERRETLLQLNVMNLTNRSWQQTRFARDHGRQVVLSITQGF